MFSHFQSK